METTTATTPRLIPLTPAELSCAGVIAEFWANENRSPTMRELAHELSLGSSSGAHRLVQGLARKGWLQPRRRYQQHGLRLTVAHFPLPAEHYFEITEAGRAAIGAPS